MITFDVWTVYTVLFQWFIQSKQCKPIFRECELEIWKQ